MRKSVELQIIHAAEAALNRPTITLEGGEVLERPEGLTVFRGRLTPIEDDELPAAVIFAGQAEATRVGGRSGPLQDRTVELDVELLAAGEPVNDILDPLETWVVAAITTDTALAALVDGVQETGTFRESDFQEQPLAGAVVRFAVRYHTRTRDRTRRS